MYYFIHEEKLDLLDFGSGKMTTSEGAEYFGGLFRCIRNDIAFG